ncbi:hypothetical protein DRP04_10860 [Archaeoglobales archaeon]|nr:MAG: hypothetical protein DRP04_10860 [Archaeoglobales archaeon]
MSCRRKSKRSVVTKKGELVVMVRKACRFGNNLYVALPKEWLEKHGIKEGDELPVIADSIIKIVPMKEI